MNYIEELYKDNTRPDQTEIPAKKTALPIELWELGNTAKKVRNNKVVGEDLIPANLIKYITLMYEKEQLKIMNEVYDKGTLPKNTSKLYCTNSKEE